MSDFNNLESIVPDRSKPQPKPPKKPKKEQEEPMKPVKQPEDLQAEKSIEFIFDKTRDVGLAQPYHLDGDPQMYTPENLSKRSSLYDDPDIQKELENFANLYRFSANGTLSFSEYKRVHDRLADTLRPGMSQQERDLVVQGDYDYDSDGTDLTRQKLKEKLFQMVDVWTSGVQRLEYLAFMRLLRVKLSRVLKS